uniref:Uncharacterized protein n=1 Tax=Opuntia streptacantha TaxID=393608 RepID=A0A7C9EPN9_OPUST
MAAGFSPDSGTPFCTPGLASCMFTSVSAGAVSFGVSSVSILVSSFTLSFTTGTSISSSSKSVAESTATIPCKFNRTLTLSFARSPLADWKGPIVYVLILGGACNSVTSAYCRSTVSAPDRRIVTAFKQGIGLPFGITIVLC